MAKRHLLFVCYLCRWSINDNQLSRNCSLLLDFRAQAESTVHMLNWAIRSVKFLGVEFD